MQRGRKGMAEREVKFLTRVIKGDNMLFLRCETDKPKGFNGEYKIEKQASGTIGFRQIPFILSDFLAEHEYDHLRAWCGGQNLNFSSNFMAYNSKSNKEYWFVEFTFANSFRFAFRNTNFKKLIIEVQNFIKRYCLKSICW
jgi:hypothetical protein